MSAYRLPATRPAIGSSSASSSAVSRRPAAAVFSASLLRRRVPGIGTTGRPCTSARWCTQARATCAAPTPRAAAIFRTGSTSRAFPSAFGPLNCGCRRR